MTGGPLAHYGVRLMEKLPIDTLMPQIVATLRDRKRVVLEAPPGAGKTTRVPRGLLDAGLLNSGEVVVLEPRRLAARLAARRVAEELGETLGETVGYQVRFEDVSSARTKIRFVTEGVLTRRALQDPHLRGVAAVLLDEFHERNLQGDLGLALLRQIQATTRPDLLLGVMSATLDTEGIAQALDAPVLRSEGRRFDVAIEYQPTRDTRPLHEQVANAVKRLVREELDGDVLVFLPGAGEIRRAIEALEPVARSHDLLVLPLHGELSPDDQDRAVRRSNKRKIIVSTNVAETSVTIDGVVAVIDSGLARIASHSAWSGLSQLRVQQISRASAIQRAGRAGRTRPGRCLRLYTKHDFDSQPASEEPEIRRLELSQTLLELRAANLVPDALPWLEPPALAAVTAAEGLLKRLGAVDKQLAPTSVGRRMARMPVHPRLARLIIEAEARGAGKDGVLLAAMLGERNLRERSLADSRAARTTVDSDPVEALEHWRSIESRGLSAERLRREGLSIQAVQSVERARRQIERHLEKSAVSKPVNVDEALRMALLAAFPDRVAKRREGAGHRLGQRELVFAQGGSAKLGEESGVDAPLVVVIDAQERREGMRAGVVVRSASAIEEEWLLDLFPDDFEDRVDVEWNASLERAEATSRILFGALVLEERRMQNPDPERLSARLLQEVRAKGVRAFTDAEQVDGLLARVAFLASAFPEAGIASPSPDVLDEALEALCEGRHSFAQLREAHLKEELAQRLVPNRSLLDRYAPESIVLPRGRRLSVEYEPDKPPWVKSRLQDFFGLKDAPQLGGRVPLVVHLLAPNYRAVQVTSDLAGFWERHYPALRQQLMRRYPRHAWPENPLG